VGDGDECGEEGILTLFTLALAKVDESGILTGVVSRPGIFVGWYGEVTSFLEYF